MAYTSRQLITRAYYLSGMISRDLQTPTGSQITEGLALLNALLAVKGSDLRLIPYYMRTSFVTVAGQEEYFIENLLAVESLTFKLNTIRFQMTQQGRIEYFGQSRADNILSLPFSYHVERELNGSRIYMYFLPADVYTMKLTAKYGLGQTTLDQDLSSVYDLYYIEYLRYALAEYICSEYNVVFPQLAEYKFKEIRKKLMDVSPPDLSVQKTGYFGTGTNINYAVVNLSYGYLPN